MSRFPAAARLSDVGEGRLLKAIASMLARPSLPPPFGVGDDGALIALHAPNVVVSHDLLLEGVDFRLSWASWADVGAKAAAANLSDLAAMGAVPRGLLLGVASSPSARARDLLALVASCDAAGKRAGAPVIGGDLSSTQGPLVVSVTAVGEVGASVLRRHLAQTGDILCVTGELGAAAAGLSLLEGTRDFAGLSAAHARRLVAAQKRPRPAARLGAALAQARCVRSAADVSDGIWGDVRHLLAPGAGVCIEPARLPVSRATRAAAAAAAGRGEAAAAALWQQWALCGGEDFSLLLAVPPAQWSRARGTCDEEGVVLTPIGRFVAGGGRTLWPPGTRQPGRVPFGHFADRPPRRRR